MATDFLIVNNTEPVSYLSYTNAVWDSSIVMAKLLEHRPALVSGKRVCDLSAGTGLVGVHSKIWQGSSLATKMHVWFNAYGAYPCMQGTALRVRMAAANGARGADCQQHHRLCSRTVLAESWVCVA